ncbi:methyltransferase [Aliikangiella sp. IMCC44359]|uniref:methyltransferase n=1 Tax=Aliikangiella sp. IMCC44359 TaxID=3459125 RepID=UPI00403A97E1
MHQFDTSFGQFEIKVLHFHPKSPLQGWNAADELILKELANYSLKGNERVLVVNDSSGALAISLNEFHPESWSDYHTNRLSLEHNLRKNQIPQKQVKFVASTESLSGSYDVVLIQLPKTLSLLEYQLTKIRAHLKPDSLIIGGGMIKHMPKAMIGLFETCIGTTRTSLAEKKARLIFSNFEPSISTKQSSYHCYGIPNSPLKLTSYANVFSQKKLDIGTRYFLSNFPDINQPKRIVDLGCGNGALGIYACWKYSDSELIFIDDSYLAIKSAQESLRQNNLTNSARFAVADGLSLEVCESVEVDTVLCNPPFHEGNKVHIDIAKRMFKGAANCLKSGGELYVVANRHLPYYQLLKRDFLQVEVVSHESKFIIAKALKC